MLQLPAAQGRGNPHLPRGNAISAGSCEMHPAVGSVNTTAMQTVTKGFMVWNKPEVAVAGGNRTQQNLLQSISPQWDDLIQKNAEKTNCSTGEVNKHWVKNGIYGCKIEICVTTSSLNWECWEDTVTQILTEILVKHMKGINKILVWWSTPEARTETVWIWCLQLFPNHSYFSCPWSVFFILFLIWTPWYCIHANQSSSIP